MDQRWQLASREECAHFPTLRRCADHDDKPEIAPYGWATTTGETKSNIYWKWDGENVFRQTKKFLSSPRVAFIFELYDNFFETTTSHMCGNHQLFATHNRKFNQLYWARGRSTTDNEASGWHWLTPPEKKLSRHWWWGCSRRYFSHLTYYINCLSTPH